MIINGEISSKITPVAVAVLRFDGEYLLAMRHTHQHQGNKLEFVGGKIEDGETPEIALIREVNEELGLDITHNKILTMGQVYHDYGDKTVVLYAYQVELTQEQYREFKHKKLGLDSQTLIWLNKNELQQSIKKLPDANRQILLWIN